MAYRKYYEDKTTVVMYKSDRESLEQMKADDSEPNAETLSRLIEQGRRADSEQAEPEPDSQSESTSTEAESA